MLQFVSEYGMLRHQDDNLDHYRRLAERLWTIYEQLSAGDRRSAAAIFTHRSGPFWLPRMCETILWSPDRPEAFELAVIPDMLEDALSGALGATRIGHGVARRRGRGSRELDFAVFAVA